MWVGGSLFTATGCVVGWGRREGFCAEEGKSQFVFTTLSLLYGRFVVR
jgi:hypothetical protein